MPVVNMESQNKEAVKMIMQLVNEGHPYTVIAKAINKELKGCPTLAYVGKGGKEKPWSNSTISGIALANGVRRRYDDRTPDRRHTERAPAKATPAPRRRRAKNGGASRWALLDAIESCPGLTPESRQALMHLAFQELNK